MTTTSTPEVAPLPDVPFHIGLAAGPAHAVEHRYATSPRREVATVCGTTARVARTWGEFARGNPSLACHELCPHCAWSVALEQGTTGAEIAHLTPDSARLAALGRAMPDPLLAVRILEQLLTADLDEVDRDPLAYLLAHVTAHRPVPLLDEACVADGCEHTNPGDCYGGTPTVACLACSVLTGPWAGEWEGQVVITVPAPCAVLPAAAAHYGLEASK
jgi:hypothetical protein